MRIILDTNVLISGIFFSGPAYQILKAWRDGKIQLIISPQILEEYHRVSETFVAQYPEIDLNPVLELITFKAELSQAPGLPESVCKDPDDDKFLACALASKVKLIISGDKHLLQVSGYRGIKVVSPRKFVEAYL